MQGPMERMHRWGATDAETGTPLPGDDLFPAARNVSTRAITIDAPAAAVWPWLQQVDQQRGGFYSYRSLENLVGARMPKVERLVPEWTERRAGEQIWLASPERFGGKGHVVVARVEPQRALALLSPDLAAGKAPSTAMSGSWTFVLAPIDDNRCRMIMRSRYAKRSLIFDTIHFVMERKMMKTIARLAPTRVRVAPGALRPT